MTARHVVRFGNTTIEYELRRSQRRKKTVQISIDGNGVQVAAPSTTPDDDIEAIVRKRAPWILMHSSGTTLEATPKRFVSGETLPYLGRNVRLIVEPADVRRPEVRFDHWRFRVAAPFHCTDASRRDGIQHALVSWYRARAEERVGSRVAHWWPRLGHGEKPSVLIRDQRRRWASCAPDGTLRFNWRIVMARPAVLDYVVVHELAHLRERNHGRRFWDEVAKSLPSYAEQKRELRALGALLTL